LTVLQRLRPGGATPGVCHIPGMNRGDTIDPCERARRACADAEAARGLTKQMVEEAQDRLRRAFASLQQSHDSLRRDSAAVSCASRSE
jgi:hypothetical protein